MQLCYPEAVEYVDEILSKLLNHHGKYHKALFPSDVYSLKQGYSYLEAMKPEDRMFGFTLFIVLNVSEGALDDF